MSYIEQFEQALYVMTILMMFGINLYLTSLISFVTTKEMYKYMIVAIFGFFNIVISWTIGSIVSGLFMSRPFLIILIVLSVLFLLWRCISVHGNAMNKNWELMFYVYCAIVLFITIFFRIGSTVPWIKVSFIELLQSFIPPYEFTELRHLFMNVILFVPFGFLLVSIDPERLNNAKYCTVGLLLSTTIESTQLLFTIGECDIGDILGNTIGTLIGIVLFTAYRRKTTCQNS